MAVASLILGILSLLLMWIPFFGLVAILTSILGIILGVVGKKQLVEREEPTGMATAGIVMSIIALILSVVFTLLCAACIGAAGLAGF